MSQKPTPKLSKAARLYDVAMGQREAGKDNQARQNLEKARAALAPDEASLAQSIAEELKKMNFVAAVVSEVTSVKAKAPAPKRAPEILEALANAKPDDPFAAAARQMVERLRSAKK